MDKYEYLTGEELGLKPSTVEQAKFEYSPLGKTFNRGLDKDVQKEGSFKRLKNIESEIKSEDEKQSEPIKNEEQSEATKDPSPIADNKPGIIVLLKDKLDCILKNFGSHFNSIGKNYLKKLEKKIDYNNLFFNIDDKCVVKNVGFLKEFGTLYDLLIYFSSSEDQINFFKATYVCRIIS